LLFTGLTLGRMTFPNSWVKIDWWDPLSVCRWRVKMFFFYFPSRLCKSPRSLESSRTSARFGVTAIDSVQYLL
jgi:hypothetical protein